jgi:hypothetical protein
VSNCAVLTPLALDIHHIASRDGIPYSHRGRYQHFREHTASSALKEEGTFLPNVSKSVIGYTTPNARRQDAPNKD